MHHDVEEKKPIALQFDQRMMKRQMASDCGFHLLVNFELWLRNFRPEKQYFRDEDIKRALPLSSLRTKSENLQTRSY